MIMTNYKTQTEISAKMRSCPRFVQDWKVNDEKRAPGAKKSKILIRQQTGVQPILEDFLVLRVSLNLGNDQLRM